MAANLAGRLSFANETNMGLSVGLFLSIYFLAFVQLVLSIGQKNHTGKVDVGLDNIFNDINIKNKPVKRGNRCMEERQATPFTDHKKAIPACLRKIQRLWKMPDKTLKDSLKIKFKNLFKN